MRRAVTIWKKDCRASRLLLRYRRTSMRWNGKTASWRLNGARRRDGLLPKQSQQVIWSKIFTARVVAISNAERIFSAGENDLMISANERIPFSPNKKTDLS